MGKTNSSTGQQKKTLSSQPVKNPPEVILKLRKNFESPENISCCLKEICQYPSKKDILLTLSGKELTKLLLALGHPGLDGKKKMRQVDVLLSGNEEFIVKFPDKVEW